MDISVALLRLASAMLLSFAALAGPVSAQPTGCQPWQQRPIATGLDRVENLEPDGIGGMLISSAPRNAIERITPEGERSTAFANVSGPGGLHVRGNTLYAVTNANVVDGFLDRANGKIETFDLRTGQRRVYSQGLTSPNGLVFDSEGNAYVSRNAGSLVTPGDPWVPNVMSGGIGSGMHIAKVPVRDPAQPETAWADLPDTNGLAVDRTNTWLYAATTFNFNAEVYRVRLGDPSVIEKVADLGGVTDPINGLDDMTFGRDGHLYITANGMGRVFRLDPSTGDRCVIASGLRNPTAAKFGRGPGWPTDHLYVTGWDGRLIELIPPQ